MNIKNSLNHFHTKGTILLSDVLDLKKDSDVRKSLVAYLSKKPDRAFSTALLNQMIDMRRNPEEELLFDTLMTACYIVGMHGHVEDCLLIWRAKETDFDTHCGVDIELVLFAGYQKTIDFLENEQSSEASKALEYIKYCGDFDWLDEYFSDQQLPWYI
jgi:hypothetical protein